MRVSQEMPSLGVLVWCALLPAWAAGIEAAKATAAGADKPLPAVCELYAPGHFGNSYEVLGPHEMRDVLAEARFWGFNRYGDWFDMDDCKDPFSPNHTYGLGDALWSGKKTHYGSAQAAGWLRDLVITPNHVYLDQCLPELAAMKGGRVFGQLICPSQPRARELILTDYENLFADLAHSGVRLTSLTACPYDFGGCRCPKCDPWIVTYTQLAHEIFLLAQKHHPQIQMDMVGWWWTADEHRLFAQWADQHAPGWVQHMYLHLPYGATQVADVPLPEGCARGAFVHIGYADVVNPRDIYGHLGPVVAAVRLEKTVADLKAQGVSAVMAYSEGVFDDVNKALLAGLWSGHYATADAVLTAYARRHLGADAASAAGWAAWLRAWGKPFEVDTRQSAATLAALLKQTTPGGWRLRQWQLKQRLFEINAQIGSAAAWTPERLAAVEQFWAVQEQIQRGVWGLGPQRHVFARRYTPLPWYASWAAFTTAHAEALGKEQ